MATTSLLNLDQRLLENLGYWKYRDAVTTALAASTSVVSTNLQKHRSTANHFIDKWIYIEDQANAGQSRVISVDDGTSTLTVLGANFTSDGSNKAYYRICPFSWENRILAIKRASKEIYPDLHIPIDNITLVSGNWLPDGHFENWSSSSALTFYSTSNGTLARTSTAGYVRGGIYSAKITTSAANGYFYIDSNSYPRLLDLMDCDIDFRAWVYAENASDAKLVIYTTKPDGTTQTLSSDTNDYAGKMELLELESQHINDGINFISFRFQVVTNGAYAYFDNARVIGRDKTEYVLPTDFNEGIISGVMVQNSSNADQACDDLHPLFYEINNFERFNDGTYNYIRLPLLQDEYLIRLIGEKPLDTVSTSDSTITIDNYVHLDVLSELAAYHLYRIEREGVSAEDRSHFDQQAIYHYGEYRRLLTVHKMETNPMKLNVPDLY